MPRTCLPTGQPARALPAAVRASCGCVGGADAPAPACLQGALPESWARMRSLAALDLWRTQVTGTLPAAWSAMQRLETLSVSDTLLAGTLPASWGKLKHLKVLQVSWEQAAPTHTHPRQPAPSSVCPSAELWCGNDTIDMHSSFSCSAVSCDSLSGATCHRSQPAVPACSLPTRRLGALCPPHGPQPRA